MASPLLLTLLVLSQAPAGRMAPPGRTAAPGREGSRCARPCSGFALVQQGQEADALVDGGSPQEALALVRARTATCASLASSVTPGDAPALAQLHVKQAELAARIGEGAECRASLEQARVWSAHAGQEKSARSLPKPETFPACPPGGAEQTPFPFALTADPVARATSDNACGAGELGKIERQVQTLNKAARYGEASALGLGRLSACEAYSKCQDVPAMPMAKLLRASVEATAAGAGDPLRCEQLVEASPSVLPSSLAEDTPATLRKLLGEVQRRCFALRYVPSDRRVLSRSVRQKLEPLAAPMRARCEAKEGERIAGKTLEQTHGKSEAPRELTWRGDLNGDGRPDAITREGGCGIADDDCAHAVWLGCGEASLVRLQDLPMSSVQVMRETVTVGGQAWHVLEGMTSPPPQAAELPLTREWRFDGERFVRR